ncbi:MAG: PEP-CTERM sorting domain-containing protein [Desulfobulbaceae bacterium]|nr:PEP-CTERM sorting domain-containing protein [Desulfobulbaceae bacterium]
MKRKYLYNLAIFLIVTTTATPALAITSSYFINDHWGDKIWHDADKTRSNTEDDLMCWAAAASNILDFGGWTPNTTLNTHDAIFTYYQNHWTDAGGLQEYGWEWWFNGINAMQGVSGWSQVDVAGGNFYSSLDFSKYYHEDWNQSTALSSIDTYLHNGYGTTLAVYTPSGGGHALSVWGIEYDTSGYLGLWLTDSDDNLDSDSPPDTLDYYAINYLGNKWVFDNKSSYKGWYIGGVMALAGAPVPVPGTLVLLGTGLGTLLVARRKRSLPC